MQRQIKFRAWHTVKEKMYSWEYIKNTYTIHALSNENVVQLKFMQYTGLKDRNGVEIYEGDITRFHTDEPTHWMQEVDIAKGRVIKEVVWHEGKFHLNKDGDVLNWHTTTKPQNLEVIGNIYENPELLNEK